MNDNILDSDCEALVNTVNCVGIMGKGLALQFKERYPMMLPDYVDNCHAGVLRPGRVSVGKYDGKYIFNFPTKNHWRSRSKLKWIDDGLHDLALKVLKLELRSIAIPPLGCGNGCLNWTEVEPLIHRHLGSLGVRVVVYPPSGTPYTLEKS